MLDGYRHHTPITVRFADLDVLGHLNHAKYLTYMEQARILYIEKVCGWSGGWDDFGVILANANVDYKLPIAFGDTVSVYTRCGRLGGKSFDLEYTLLRHREDEPDAIAAVATTVMVAYDYGAGQAIPVPANWRDNILAYEPALEEASG